MEHPIQTVDPFSIFPQLAETPRPPKQLFVRGSLDALAHKKIVTVVGARRCTPYGVAACRSLIEGLAGYPIVIVSGLALGIDSVAHEAALEAGMTTIAFPGSGLDWNVVYPAQHRDLAKRIIEAGGALISEYKPDQHAALWTFPQRNRIVAGVADLVVIIEAEEASGALITARLGTEYNKIVGVVPGAINSPASKGTHQFLKLGAVPITESADILRELGLEYPTEKQPRTLVLNEKEEAVLAILTGPMPRDEIIERLGGDAVDVTVTLSTLEIKGVIRETLGLVERMF